VMVAAQFAALERSLETSMRSLSECGELCPVRWLEVPYRRGCACCGPVGRGHTGGQGAGYGTSPAHREGVDSSRRPRNPGALNRSALRSSQRCPRQRSLI
jgi:hypothetical protein